MKLTEMRQLLAERDIQLTKSLGQNFLHDGNQLRRIVDTADVQATDNVLEIGPGLGPLTELLLARAKHVLAIETDRRMVDILRERFANVTNFELLHADALAWLQHERRDWSAWKLVANLPYSAASPILVELAKAPSCPARMTATLQTEVARRIVAHPGSHEYGILTLLIQLRYEPKGWFRISASCFHPPPDVDSACITLLRRAEPLLTPVQAEVFERLVKRAFSQRRKMMFKLLKADWPEAVLGPAYEQIGLSAQVRAEGVSLDQFVTLTHILRA